MGTLKTIMVQTRDHWLVGAEKSTELWRTQEGDIVIKLSQRASHKERERTKEVILKAKSC